MKRQAFRTLLIAVFSLAMIASPAFMMTSFADGGNYEVGGTAYDTLQAAVNATDGSNKEIMVLRTCSETANVTIPAGKDVVLKTADGAKFTLNGSVAVNGKFEMNDNITVEATGSNNAVSVGAGGEFIMNGGSALSSAGNGVRLQGSGDTKATATLNNFTRITGHQSAVNVANGGELKKLAGSGTIHATYARNARALWVQAGGHVTEIAGGNITTEDGSGNYAICLFSNSSSYAVIDKISGGTFTGADAGLYINGHGHIKEISGGTFTGENGAFINGGTGDTMTISGGTFEGDGYGLMAMSYGNMYYDITGGKFTGGAAGIGNLGNINRITNATIEGEMCGVLNYLTITEIDGATITATGSDGYAIYNGGTITTIAGGTFTGTDALENYKTISSITGGTFNGSEYGIYNDKNGTISSIDVAAEGDLVVTGSDGPAVLNNKGTITKIAGAGIYIGKESAIKSTGGTVALEPGLTAVTGNGRYKTNSNTPASQLDGVSAPDGYHMVRSVTDSNVEGADGSFRYLIKDNSIIYDGNGHKVKNQDASQITESYEGATVDLSNVDVQDRFEPDDMEFTGWNTAADGSGTAYAPDDSVEIADGADMILYAQWEVKKYNITYNLNGGTFNGSSDDIVEKYESGSVISIHDAPEREGYKFLYWKGSEHQPGDQYTVSGDHTFEAQWEKIADGDSDDPANVDPLPTGVNGPRTGDYNHLGLWSALLIAALAGFLGTIIYRIKKN